MAHALPSSFALSVQQLRSARLLPPAAFVAGALLGAWLSSASAPQLRPRGSPPPPAPAADGAATDEPAYLRDEQLSRSRAFFAATAAPAADAAGPPPVTAGLESAFVVVIGVGGVGSHAAAALARSGVARLRLVDYDYVSLSSLNRHATATRADVGSPKTVALAAALRRAVPWLAAEPVQRVFDARAAQELLAGSPDFVLDCIDDIDTKAALLAACAERGIPIVSSLGAGGRADPTRLHIGDLGDVRADPLASALRKALRRARRRLLHPKEGDEGPRGDAATAADGDDGGEAADGEDAGIEGGGGSGGVPVAPRVAAAVPTGITCVFSSEPPRARLLPLPLDREAGEAPADFGAAEGFRVRVVPVLGALPAAFGYAMAAHVLGVLAGAPLTPVPCSPLPGAANKALRALIVGTPARYDAAWPQLATAPVPTLDEAAFVMDTLWRQRSAVSGARATARGSPLRLARWRPDRVSSPTNLVLMTAVEVAAHDAATVAALRGGESAAGDADARFAAAVAALLGAETVARIEARLAWARQQGWW